MSDHRQVSPLQLQQLMHLAFDHVADPADKRGPIDCLVPWDVANVYMQAIEFMVGAAPLCQKVMQRGQLFARLTSPGYRNGPAGA